MSTNNTTQPTPYVISEKGYPVYLHGAYQIWYISEEYIYVHTYNGKRIGKFTGNGILMIDLTLEEVFAKVDSGEIQILIESKNLTNHE